MRYPPVGPSRRSAPCGSTGDAAKTGRPAIPASRYSTWLAIPSRAPSAAPPSSTTIGCSVNGTGVNGSGTLICAAAAVSAAITARRLRRECRAIVRATRIGGEQEFHRAADSTVMAGRSNGMHTALTIAGSDSGGGAGIQADLKTFAAHGVYGTSRGHRRDGAEHARRGRWQALPADLVTAQIEAVVGDIGADAVKIGMLANAAIVEAVAAAIRELDLPQVVLDPVMVAKGGDRLIADDGVATIRSELLRLAHVVTPNVPEAEVLAGMHDPVAGGHARGRDADPPRWGPASYS